MLKLNGDPLAYAKDEIKKLNYEFRVGRAAYSMTVDFNEKVATSNDDVSRSEAMNVGYFFIQYIYQ